MIILIINQYVKMFFSNGQLITLEKRSKIWRWLFKDIHLTKTENREGSKA